MKEFAKKVSDFLRVVFGYGIMTCLLVGGLTFFGYVAALIIGGDTAALICEFIYKKIFPVIFYASTILVLLGIAVMYLNGETALTAGKKKSEKNKSEN